MVHFNGVVDDGPLEADIVVYEVLNATGCIEDTLTDDPASPHTPVLHPQPSFTQLYDSWPADPLQPVCPQPVEEELPHVVLTKPSRHSHGSKHRKHRRENSSGTTDSVSSRSQSFSSSTSSSTGSLTVLRSSNSYAGSSSSSGCCANRPKSFTTAQLHAQRHRLAACSAASRSCSPTSDHGASHVGKRLQQQQQQHSMGCTTVSSRAAQRQHAAGAVTRQASSSQLLQHKLLLLPTNSGSGYCAMDMRLLVSSGSSLPQCGLLLAESMAPKDIGKGFQLRWYHNRLLNVYNGYAAAAQLPLLLKHVPQQPGLHLWLIKPPCGRQWVPVRLDACDNLRQGLAGCLHADGSCGPPGFKQRVLLDLQCRGFAVQIRYRPMKASCGSVQQDLLSKLQRFDFALNDVDNNGCRPIELPDGRPVASYPWLVGDMMKLYNQLFVQGRAF